MYGGELVDDGEADVGKSVISSLILVVAAGGGGGRLSKAKPAKICSNVSDRMLVASEWPATALNRAT